MSGFPNAFFSVGGDMVFINLVLQFLFLAMVFRDYKWRKRIKELEEMLEKQQQEKNPEN